MKVDFVTMGTQEEPNTQVDETINAESQAERDQITDYIVCK